MAKQAGKEYLIPLFHPPNQSCFLGFGIRPICFYNVTSLQHRNEGGGVEKISYGTLNKLKFG